MLIFGRYYPNLKLEVIIDYGSALVTYLTITETTTKSSRKESSFLAAVPLIKLIGAANLQSPVIARKFLPWCHRTDQIRMRSDERENAFLGQIYCTYLSTLRTL